MEGEEGRGDFLAPNSTFCIRQWPYIVAEHFQTETEKTHLSISSGDEEHLPAPLSHFGDLGAAIVDTTSVKTCS